MSLGEAVQADVLGLVDDLGARGCVRVHQVLLDLGLAVDGDDLAGQRLRGRCDGDLPSNAISTPSWIRRSRAEPVADAGLRQQIDRALLEQAGAHARAQVLRRAPLQHRRFRCRRAPAAAPAAARPDRRRQFRLACASMIPICTTCISQPAPSSAIARRPAQATSPRSALRPTARCRIKPRRTPARSKCRTGARKRRPTTPAAARPSVLRC